MSLRILSIFTFSQGPQFMEIQQFLYSRAAFHLILVTKWTGVDGLKRVGIDLKRDYLHETYRIWTYKLNFGKGKEVWWTIWIFGGF